jgi:hypothetical protein
VYVAISRQIYPAVTVNVTNLGRPIPHLVLFAQFSRYQISSVQSWRAGRSGPMRVLAAQAIPHHGAGRILDLGRLPSGASVTVTYYLSRKQVAMFGPGPLTYTIRGYGTLRRDGRPDYSAVLSGTPSHFGSGALPQVQREPVCGGDNLMHMTLSKYQLQGSGTITFGSGSVLTQTLLNCGKSIEHLVISIRLKYAPRDGIVHIRAVRHAGTLETTQQPVWLRGASTKEATVYDLGMLPSASEIRVTVATSSGSSSSGDVIRVYARLSWNGQPDPRSLVFSGTDTWRQG